MAERRTVVQVITKVDKFLSDAQSELAKHLVNADVKQISPQAYKVGDDAWESIEALRWKLRATYNNLGKKR